MTQFENVTVIKEVNAYFDGNVTSRTVVFPDGSKQSLGVMLPGEYEFGTDAKELMEIMSGDVEVLLPNASEWQAIKGGQTFEVPASSKFQIKVKAITDYCCAYVQ
ncbi:MAG: pyrimidine/purine nucleoside phosphorylase [Cyanobacteria bacterium P01_F01_bin.150]